MKSAVLDDLIAHLSRLPGLGERTATRLAFHLLRSKPQYRQGLASSIERLSSIVLCRQCRNVSERSPCSMCESPVRNFRQLCVVEKASDIYPIERMGSFKGRYFVLHGLLNPMEGTGPQDIGLPKLVESVQEHKPEEVILALNPTVEGDVTAAYVSRLLLGSETKISRLASGLPMGSELEYADQITLGKAFEGRTLLR